MTAVRMQSEDAHAVFVVDRFSTMSRRALLRFILSGQGSDAERSTAAFRLVTDYGYRTARYGKLVDKGWWAARPAEAGLAF